MNPPSTALLDLFPETEFRHRMRYQPGSVAGFFGATAEAAAVLAERRRWLETDPAEYAGALPEGTPLIDEALTLLREAAILDSSFRPSSSAQAMETILALGRSLEPDFLLLRPDAAGAFQFLAGCVCFPSSWSLAEKMGRPLEFIHDVVPGLNAQLGRAIDAFLTKLAPGEAWQRSNWGLSRSPELNQHPGRGLRKRDSSVSLEEVWLRVEHQVLVRLPATGGVLFGIRLANHPLADIKGDTELTRRFCLALETMSEPMAQYKGVASARATLLTLMR